MVRKGKSENSKIATSALSILAKISVRQDIMDFITHHCLNVGTYPPMYRPTSCDQLYLTAQLNPKCRLVQCTSSFASSWLRQ